MKYEKHTEAKFCTLLRRWALDQRLDLAAVKLTVPGFRGWPDRMVMWQGGHILFIEFKREGETPRPLQNIVHELIRTLGFEIDVHDNIEVALEATKAKILAAIVTGKGPEVATTERGGPHIP